MFGAPHIECLQCPVDMTTLWQAFKIDCAFFIGFDKLHDCVTISISKLIIGLSEILEFSWDVNVYEIFNFFKYTF